MEARTELISHPTAHWHAIGFQGFGPTLSRFHAAVNGWAGRGRREYNWGALLILLEKAPAHK